MTIPLSLIAVKNLTWSGSFFTKSCDIRVVSRSQRIQIVAHQRLTAGLVLSYDGRITWRGYIFTCYPFPLSVASAIISSYYHQQQFWSITFICNHYPYQWFGIVRGRSSRPAAAYGRLTRWSHCDIRKGEQEIENGGGTAPGWSQFLPRCIVSSDAVRAMYRFPPT